MINVINQSKGVVSEGAKLESQSYHFNLKLIDSQEKERKRIAAELHDGICQTLGFIKYKLESLQAVSSTHSDVNYSKELNNVVNDICGAMDEVRNISVALWPAMLEDLGLLKSIGCLCRKFSNTFADIDIDRQIDLDESFLSDHQKLAIYRIVQEAANNSVKHAHAQLLVIKLQQTDSQISLHIRDNGKGFNVSEHLAGSVTNGIGLKSMSERTRLSGGRFSIRSVIGEGTVIHARWPVGGRNW